jgi:hypothetical protein
MDHSSGSETPFEEWRKLLAPEDRKKADELLSAYKHFGASFAEELTRAEISSGSPEFARYLFLRRLWPEVIDSWKRAPSEWIDRVASAAARNPEGHFADAGLALQKMRDRGVADEDIAAFARMVAYETTFAVLSLIGEGGDLASPLEVGWRIEEVAPDGQPTGREMHGFHELILSMDPTGREGRAE